MINPNNFIANSDYPFDMVAKVMEGSVVRPKPHGQVVSFDDFIIIPHNLGFRPLVAGYWSDTPTFENCYNFGYVKSDNDKTFAFDSCGADENNFYFLPMGNVGNEYWYRIFCLVPSSLSMPVDHPDLMGFGKYTFNSDLAYMKIAREGEVEWGDEEVSIKHNLGYIPFVRLWSSFFSGLNSYREILMVNTGSAGAIITGSELIIRNPTNISGNTVYRIYADET